TAGEPREQPRGLFDARRPAGPRPSADRQVPPPARAVPPAAPGAVSPAPDAVPARSRPPVTSRARMPRPGGTPFPAAPSDPAATSVFPAVGAARSAPAGAGTVPFRAPARADTEASAFPVAAAGPLRTRATARLADLDRLAGEPVVPEILPRPRRPRTTTPSRTVAVVTSAAVAVGALAYAVADAADVVPGILTAGAAAATPPPRPEPVVSLPPAADATVLTPGTEGPALSPAAVSQRIGPALADPRLGDVTASVVDVATGEVLVDSGASRAMEPASTTKVLTAVAALQVLGADRTLPTSSSLVPATATGAATVVLTGGGDVMLAAGTAAADPRAASGRAGLGDLAAATVAALPPGTTAVDVVVDDSLLGGSQDLARTAGDQPFYSPPASLGIEAGDRGTGVPRDPVPATSAGEAFAEGLRAAGVTVGSVVVTTTPVTGASPLADVRSAPVSDIVAHSLSTSDNTVSDALAGLVARELGAEPSLPEAGRLLVEAVAATGVDTTGTVVQDGSGLSRGSVVPASVLAGVLRAAATSDDPDLGLLPRLLPVAGLSGTLSERFASETAADAGGVVRAKTGSLSGSRTLAGYATTADGRTVAFSIMSAIPEGTGADAEAGVDAVVAALVGCGCAVQAG
ncbi:MAG: D-alanyl-D-alanine carboxypeptidase/D-alanyl-D-alanine-endopeptidase, partial [Kineosporiaceae bacterium]